MTSQGSSNGSTCFSGSNIPPFPSYISVLGEEIKIHDIPSLLNQTSSKLFSPDHPIRVWAQTTSRALLIFNILTDESYNLLDNSKVASGKGIVGKIYKGELKDGINSIMTATWSDWATTLDRCKKIIDNGANGKTNFNQIEVLFHLLFVDKGLAKVMERVERYNRENGPIIKSVKMEIRGCVRPPIKRNVPKEEEEEAVNITKRTTDGMRPAMNRTEGIPGKLERKGVERALLWMLALFLLVLMLAVRGIASMLS